MSAFSEGDRVVIDYVRGGYHEDQFATVVQTSETQPHFVWVEYDDSDLRRIHGQWVRIGSRHLKPAEHEE